MLHTNNTHPNPPLVRLPEQKPGQRNTEEGTQHQQRGVRLPQGQETAPQTRAAREQKGRQGQGKDQDSAQKRAVRARGGRRQTQPQGH